MSTPVVVSDVWKTFGNTAAVRGINLEVPSRSVYGFLGPNGAGKPTTIRMILGLLRPDCGNIQLFGHPLRPGATAALRRLGSLVEAPSLYQHLTGRENLELHRLLLDVPKTAVDEALETMDLRPAADQLVRGYSSGMKQRLGIAQALLGSPELLLLDEPTNALDPAGIHEIRELIRNLPNRRNATVFLSSHLLAEVEQTATHVAIIAEGQLRFQGTTRDLQALHKPSIVMQVDDAIRARTVLATAGHVAAVEGNQVRLPSDTKVNAAEINRVLVLAGVGVSHLAIERRTLEETFLRITVPAKSTQDGGADGVASSSR